MEEIVTEEKVEEVLVIADSALEAFKGLQKRPFSMEAADIDKIAQVLRGAFFIRRPEAEETPAYKQVIPYLIISSGEKYLTFTRSGTEARLHDLISLGFGGHINPSDGEGLSWGLIHNAIRREVQEELSYDGDDEDGWEEFCAKSPWVLGVLYDGSDAVGRVHVGIILGIDVDESWMPHLKMSNEGKNLTWRTREQLRYDSSHLEGWARICFRYLLGGSKDELESWVPTGETLK
jgi:predicted NUDIX family phosphoesterase